MSLKLEIIGPQAAALGAGATRVFSDAGGTIGRAPGNAWVIPDPYVSSHHARVHYRGPGKYLLEDTSSNGVFINSPENRLPRGELHALQSGDRIFIDTYEIRVTVDSTVAAATSPFDDLFGPAAVPASSVRPTTPLIPEDPFGAPMSAAPSPTPIIPPDDSLFASLAGSEPQGTVDPLQLLGGGAPPQRPASAPRLHELPNSPLQEHFQPPAPRAPVAAAPPASATPLIPDDWMSEASEPVDATQALPPPAPPPRPAPGRRATNEAVRAQIEPQSQQTVPMMSGSQPAPVAPAIAPSALSPAAVDDVPASAGLHATPGQAGDFDFAALLAAAGVRDVQVTPELAENFGRILQVVVAGLMDVLRARERIKDEFRMRMTTFKAADNNPLKFSANVEDALHNLLVKRNSAYLGPVEAFEDAFQDVRNHQMAMLAGVRAAFDTMLQEFAPEQLEERFDRQLKTGSILSAPARLKYWDLYRDRFRDMVKDPESTFRELFGEEFARAYEQQLESLKGAARVQRK